MLTSMTGVCGSSPLDWSLNFSGNSLIQSGSLLSSPFRTIAAQTILRPSASGGTSRSYSSVRPA